MDQSDLLVIGELAIVVITLGTLIFMKDKAQSDRMIAVERRFDDKLIDVHNSCARREELLAMRNDIVEIRHTLADLVKIFSNRKENS